MTKAQAPVDLEALLFGAVREILRHEDPDRFQAWLRERLGDFLDPDAEDAIPPEAWPAIAGALGRAVWNATPLPGNRFRPAPLPAPGRNDPCPCGSGRKFKQCCAGAPAVPAIDPEVAWDFAVDALTREQLVEALALKRVPVSGLARHAEALLEDGDAERAAALLAPVLEGPLAALRSEAHEFALDVFVNALDDLGEPQRKRALLDRVTREASRSPLRAGAWERLAAIRMDEDDTTGAWEAFKQAQRDQPDAPALAHLEVLLLGAEGREDEIPGRARYWIRRLRRQGFEDGDDLIDWLEGAASDPDGTVAEMERIGRGDVDEPLRDWLDRVHDCPLPRYALCDEAPDEREDENDALAARLSAMGIPRDQIAESIEMFHRNRRDSPPGEEEADEEVPLEGPDSQVLAGPAELRAIERRWHEVFAAAKPFSVNDALHQDESSWEDEAQWTAFLSEHPQAFDSLDILDDLATAVLAHPIYGEPSFDREMLAPLLERAAAIVDGALEGTSAPRLAWVVAENRPALRALVRLALLARQEGDDARVTALAERLLSLNPHDNHGFRSLLMDQYLLAGRDEEAVALAERYPDDDLAETRYGQALALYRLGRREAADEALAGAVASLPKVREYLVKKRVRAPKLDDTGAVSIGGADQAWVYRETMRPEWHRTPGAMDWLAKAKPS